jgi:hypothetical protein
MEDESLALDDATTNKTAQLSTQTVFNFGKGSPENEKTNNISSIENHLIRSRRYDVSITYDNYYRTPRIWLFGFDDIRPDIQIQCVSCVKCGNYKDLTELNNFQYILRKKIPIMCLCADNEYLDEYNEYLQYDNEHYDSDHDIVTTDDYDYDFHHY